MNPKYSVLEVSPERYEILENVDVPGGAPHWASIAAVDDWETAILLVSKLNAQPVETPVASEAQWRKAITDQVRADCTPPLEAYDRGRVALVYAVADWIENPPEWSKFVAPVGVGHE